MLGIIFKLKKLLTFLLLVYAWARIFKKYAQKAGKYREKRKGDEKISEENT
ncbi:hypothetical protein [Methanosarcina sp. KYL-1]|uniref:hypothetical protein n=1 Tax=Methanosarcina sp. KYL-1 TaxID=2602068 RepID=UPI002100F225|nr:hypothetical protein [Methanosarcina sp. KYL-1]